MLSLSVLVLALLPVLVVALALLGSLLRWAIGLVLPARAPVPTEWVGAVSRLVEDIALGTALIPCLYVLATVLDVSVTAAVAWGALALAAGVYGWRLWKRPDERGFPFRSGTAARSRAPWLGLIALLAVFAVIVAVRVVPYVPFEVYSGNDVRMFTLITQLVQVHGHFTSSWGAFAGPTWNSATDNHLIFEGSEAVFAFVNYWVPWNTPQLVSATVLCFNCLIPLSAFALLRRLFPTRPAALPVLGALSFGVILAYPAFFLQWGGIDETLGWFLFPIGITLFLDHVRSASRPLGGLVLAGLVLGATAAVNPFSFVYVLTFVASLSLAALFARRNPLRALPSVVGFFAIALLVIAPLIAVELTGYLHYQTAVPAGVDGWGTFQTGVVLRPGEVWGSFRAFISLLTGLASVAVAVVLGLIGLLYFARRESACVALLFWVLLLVLLNTNGPFGLYWVRYPFWADIEPDRLIDLIGLPVSGGIALVLSSLWVRATTRAPARESPTRDRFRWSLAARSRPTAGAVLVVLLVGLGAASAATYQNNATTVAWGNAVTPQDLVAFGWIEGNVPKNATVLVNLADSGTWIPEFSGVRVFPYLELINNPAVFPTAESVSSYFVVGESATTLSFLSQYNLSYAFVGARTQYSLSQNLTVPPLIDQPVVRPWVDSLSACLPAGNYSIELTCNGDSVAFRGPIVVQLQEYHNGTPVGVTRVGIPNGTVWNFVLQTGTPEWPGVWTADFNIFPLATTAFADGSATVLKFDPAFLALESSGAGVTYYNSTVGPPQL